MGSIEVKVPPVHRVAYIQMVILMLAAVCLTDHWKAALIIRGCSYEPGKPGQPS